MADVFDQVQPKIQQVLDVYNRAPFTLSAEALLAYMCFAWEQKIRAPLEQVRQSPQFQQSTPQQQEQWLAYLGEQIDAEKRDRNYSLALWRQFAQGATPQERQRRLIDALTLEALSIEEEYVQRKRGIVVPVVDRSRFFVSPSPGAPSAFDSARAQLFTLVIHQVDPNDGTVVDTAWWNISPAVSDPSFIYFDGVQISPAEWSRVWEGVATNPNTISQLEDTDVCSEIWSSLLRPPFIPVQIDVVDNLRTDQLIEPYPAASAVQAVIIQDVSPERITPPAKRTKLMVEEISSAVPGQPQLLPAPFAPTGMASRPQPQQQLQQTALAFAQQSRSQPPPPPNIPPPAQTLAQQLYGEPAELERCYICQEACVPENVQLVLIGDFESWYDRQNRSGGVLDENVYVDENQQNSERLIQLVTTRAQAPSRDHAEQYVQAWLSKGLSNFVSSRSDNEQVMRYFRVRCSDHDTPHNMQMCKLCLNESVKRPAVQPGRGAADAMIRSLPLLDMEKSRTVQLAAACPVGCPRATIRQLYPFDPATGQLYGQPLECGTEECYKPSKWDDDLIGPYSLYMENLCFFRSGYIDSSAINLFVGIVKGYDADHSSRAGTDGQVAEFETIDDARYPKRIIVEWVFPAAPKNEYGSDIVRYESVPIQEVYPITVLPGMPQGVAERRYNSLQQAVEAATATMQSLAAAPPTNSERIKADLNLRRLEQMFAEAKGSLEQQKDKLAELLEENRRIGGSSLLLKKRGVRPSIKRASRDTACDICCGILENPELVRVYSSDQAVTSQCKIQLDAEGAEYPIGVTDDYVYKRLTEEDKNRIRTHVLFTLLGFHHPTQLNPQFKTLIQQHFREPSSGPSGIARVAKNPGYMLAALVLLGVRGIQLTFPFEQGRPDTTYQFVRNLWNEVFTAVDPATEWPEPTQTLGWYDFRSFEGTAVNLQAIQWRESFSRYNWVMPRTSDFRLVYADRPLNPSELDEISSRKRKRDQINGSSTTPMAAPARPVPQQQQQQQQQGPQSSPFAAPARPVPQQQQQQPPPLQSSPFAAPARPVPQQQQQQPPQPSPFAANAVTPYRPVPGTVPGAPGALSSRPMTAEQLGIPVVSTRPSGAAALTATSSSAALVTTAPQQQQQQQKLHQQLQSFQPTQTLPLVRTMQNVPSVSQTAAAVVTTRPLISVEGPSPPPSLLSATTSFVPQAPVAALPPAATAPIVTGVPQISSLPAEASNALVPRPTFAAPAVVSTSTRSTAAGVAATGPIVTMPGDTGRRPAQRRPSISTALAIGGPPPPPSSITMGGNDNGSLVIRQTLPPPAAIVQPSQGSNLPAIMPQLQDTVADWNNWALQLAAAVGRPNVPEFYDLAAQWLQSRLDQILQTNIQSQAWAQIPDTVRNSIIGTFRNDLQIRNYL